jgi:hypothetical protein
MNKDFRQRIYNNMSLKETDDLLRIWFENNRDDWSDIAFEIIEEILIERLGKIPSIEDSTIQTLLQSNQEKEDTAAEELDNLTLAMDQIKETGHITVFYDPNEVIQIKRFINKGLIYVIGALILFSLIKAPEMFNIIHSFFSHDPKWILLAITLTFFMFVLCVTFECFIYYIGFKSLSSILGILMEMEFSSRKSDQERVKLNN